MFDELQTDTLTAADCASYLKQAKAALSRR